MFLDLGSPFFLLLFGWHALSAMDPPKQLLVFLLSPFFCCKFMGSSSSFESSFSYLFGSGLFFLSFFCNPFTWAEMSHEALRTYPLHLS